MIKSAGDFAILLIIPMAAVLGLTVVGVTRLVRFWNENKSEEQKIRDPEDRASRNMRLRISVMPHVRPLGLKRVNLQTIDNVPYIRPSRIRVHFKKSDFAKPVDECS